SLAAGERWRPHPPPAIRLGPGERRPYTFHLEDISPVPIGVSGHYDFGGILPASVHGGGTFPPVHFRIDGPVRLRGGAAASLAIFVATVDSIMLFRPDIEPAHEVKLVDHRFLLGDVDHSPPGNVFFVDWHRRLPLRPMRGRRYIFFLDRDWYAWHVAV